MTRLGWAEIEALRREPGRSMLLFITDRCPVGCAHCSVDSRHDSPTITDFALFEEIVGWLCDSGLDVVGVSGGEPFVERRGLSYAARRVTDAGKRLVVYTSGVWATRTSPPAWIREVLERSATVFLSTDAFHAAAVDDRRYVRAARAVAAADCWIVVQVPAAGTMLDDARTLLERAFGTGWEEHAEVRQTPPLTHGRGAGVFARGAGTPARAFGPCAALASPMIRYDGVATACCNESTIMGWGPAALRRRAASRDELDAALDGFRADPMLRAIAGVGPGALVEHPRFADLADAEFPSICDVCWRMLGRTAHDTGPDPLVEAVSTVLVAGA